MSTKSHDAKKAMEHNLLLSEQKNLKKNRQENVSNRIAKCRALKKARVNNNASWQKQQQKQRDCFGSVTPINSVAVMRKHSTVQIEASPDHK